MSQESQPEQPKLLLDPNDGQNVDHVILVELDALLDTRLGVLASIDVEHAKKVIESPGYYERVSDDFSIFCDLPDAVYREAYKNRTAEILPLSTITNIVLVLSEVTQALEHQRLNSTKVNSVTVEINLWPYELDEDITFSLESAVAARLPSDVTVRSVRKPLSDITLNYVKHNLTGLILYNFAEWMQQHVYEFKDVQVPKVTFLVPRLHVSGTKGYKKGDFGVGYEHVDPYEALQAHHSPLLGLEFLGPNLFSVFGQSTVDFNDRTYDYDLGEIDQEDIDRIRSELDELKTGVA